MIAAIKLYRVATGMDLKDSKEAIEELTKNLEKEDPAKFARLRKQSVSPGTLVFWGAVAALVAYVALKGS
ncbi:MAG: hypothetical protein NUV51_00180 [Sulfuricaulis sp.]|nr:hypothetical protein [Sulfuricaulis sp.]